MTSPRSLLNAGPRFLKALVLAGTMMHAPVAEAQPTITKSGLGTEVGQNQNVYTIYGGTRSGRNLFHSFGLFSIVTGGKAAFCPTSDCATATAELSNILSRVTQGTRSEIDGTIDTTAFLGANLFLINPAGVMFGPNAHLNVNGAFHVSTADYLRLRRGSDGVEGIFSADPSKPTILTAEPPVAFGFLRPTPAPISIPKGGNLKAPALSIVGGDVTIVGTAAQDQKTLEARGGRVQIVSVASPGDVTLNPDMSVASVASFTRLGKIEIKEQAAIDVSAPLSSGMGSGTVTIRGGRLIIDDATLVATSEGRGAPIAMDLRTTEAIELRKGALIKAATSASPRFLTSTAGSIEVNTPTLTVTGGGVQGTQISSVVGLLGQGGKITVTATDADLSGRGSAITSDAGRAGHGGDIEVHTRRLSVRDGARILTQGDSIGFFTSQVGDVTITAADRVSLAGNTETGIFSRYIGLNSDGQSGRISLTVGDPRLHVGTLTLSGGGAQVRNGDPNNNGNSITITAGNSILISDRSAITSNAFKIDAGPVRLSAPTITLDNGFVNATTFGHGRGGRVEVNADTLTLTRGSQITTSSLSTVDAGNAGDVTITVGGSLRMRDSLITTSAETAGGGRIVITGGSRSLVDVFDSRITTSVHGGGGDAGNITIDPQFVVLDHSQVRANAFGGRGGNINIVSDFFLTNESTLNASSALSTSGTISIQSRFTELSSSVAPLPAGLAQAATLLRASCASRVAAGKASSLAVTGREGVPLEPGGYLPSPLMAPELGGVEPSGSDAAPLESLPRLSLSVFAPDCSR